VGAGKAEISARANGQRLCRRQALTFNHNRASFDWPSDPQGARVCAREGCCICTSRAFYRPLFRAAHASGRSLCRLVASSIRVIVDVEGGRTLSTAQHHSQNKGNCAPLTITGGMRNDHSSGGLLGVGWLSRLLAPTAQCSFVQPREPELRRTSRWRTLT
jgi:hypothetical protein